MADKPLSFPCQLEAHLIPATSSIDLIDDHARRPSARGQSGSRINRVLYPASDRPCRAFVACIDLEDLVACLRGDDVCEGRLP